MTILLTDSELTMTDALTVSVSGGTPAEVAARLRGVADALTSEPGPAPTGGLPDVPSTPAPKLCTVHHTPLRFDEWESKAGKACKAWRCPQSTAASDCTIEWAS